MRPASPLGRQEWLPVVNTLLTVSEIRILWSRQKVLFVGVLTSNIYLEFKL